MLNEIIKMIELSKNTKGQDWRHNIKQIKIKINEYAKEYHESKVKKLNIHDVMASVSDTLLLKAGKYEDEANADFDTEGVQHNLNIGRYDGLMQAIQEINKHLP